MAELIDCRGLSCPEPVLQVRRALQETGEKTLHVLVSSAAARDNVKRAAAALSWEGQVESTEDGDKLILNKS